jgi:hypothetical protein
MAALVRSEVGLSGAGGIMVALVPGTGLRREDLAKHGAMEMDGRDCHARGRHTAPVFTPSARPAIAGY